MKRLFSTRDRAVYSERRRRKLEYRRLRPKTVEGVRVGALPKQSTPVSFQGTLDPVSEDSETIINCKKIRDLLKSGTPVFVDLSKLEGLTLAGAMYLAATIDNVKMPESQPPPLVRGNMPENKAVASEFLASGFFAGFKTNDDRKLPTAQGAWRRREERQVVAQTAADLVDFARQKIGMTPEQGRAIWQNLVECMTNTRNHSRNEEANEEPWIAGVMCSNNVAHFAFVDEGVGICGSTEAQSRLKFRGLSLIGYGPDRLVKDAFEGKLGSSTGAKGRGLGLPRMRRDARAGLLQNLHVRTGRAMGQINKMVFRRTKHELRGTVFTWTAKEWEQGS